MALFFFCCLKGRKKKIHPKDGLRVGSPVIDNLGNSGKKDFTSLSNANSFSSESEDSRSEEIASGEVPSGDTFAKLPLPPGRRSASGRKYFTRAANVNRFTIKPDNSLTEEKVSEEKVLEQKVSGKKVPEEKVSQEKVSEEKASEAMEVRPGDNCAKLPLPPGRVPPPPPKSPAAPKPTPPVPGSSTPTTEPAIQDPKPAAASPPPPPPPNNLAPRAPPPPKIGQSPPNPPKSGNVPKPPHGKGRLFANKENKETNDSGGQKAKLKPFFWDKVLANPERSMVWNELKAGSFQFNEEMMEDLFGYKMENNKNDENTKKKPAMAPKYIQIIDTKKAQNLSIMLKALNVTTEEVCDAIQEGNELPAELIEALLKMAPTSQEELQLRLYSEDISRLGPADRFIKTLVDIPFAYQRLDALFFMCTLQNESFSIKECFAVLEVACKELKSSRLFLKLLEAVLKTGNRMNDGTFRGGAKAFKLDTLLKLSDVKGADGKTTLLHFVVLEIIRSEGKRAVRRLRESSTMSGANTEDLLEETPENQFSLGLDVVSNLSNELANVKKAAVVDGDMLATTVAKLAASLKQSERLLANQLSGLVEECEFHDTLSNFIQQAAGDIIWMLEEETKITALVKSTADYFHGTPGKDEGMRLFMIVRDFLVMVDKVCQEVKKSGLDQVKTPKKEAPSASTS